MLSRAGHRSTVVLSSISLSLRFRNEIEWLRRILPRGFSKLPKRALIPQMRNNFHFGELRSCFCCLVRKLMVARVLRLRMSVIRAKETPVCGNFFCYLGTGGSSTPLSSASTAQAHRLSLRIAAMPMPKRPLSLRSRNEIDELLFAVHVELPIDIAPMSDGGSFRYNQFFLNACEGVALRKNDENLEFSRG